MEARFTVTSGPLRGQTFQIPHGKFIIGREPDCQLLLDNSFVSRHHCVLLMDDYTLRIRDLGSKNGTFINSVLALSGARILAHGDTIRVADLIFRVEVFPTGPSSQVALDGTDVSNLDTTQFDGRPPADCTAGPPSTAEV